MAQSIERKNRVLRRRRNRRKLAAMIGPIAVLGRFDFDLDGLAAIQRLHSDAVVGSSDAIRGTARAALQHWKKRRGWRRSRDRKKQGARWTQLSKLG